MKNKYICKSTLFLAIILVATVIVCSSLSASNTFPPPGKQCSISRDGLTYSLACWNEDQPYQPATKWVQGRPGQYVQVSLHPFQLKIRNQGQNPASSTVKYHVYSDKPGAVAYYVPNYNPDSEDKNTTPRIYNISGKISNVKAINFPASSGVAVVRPKEEYDYLCVKFPSSGLTLQTKQLLPGYNRGYTFDNTAISGEVTWTNHMGESKKERRTLTFGTQFNPDLYVYIPSNAKRDTVYTIRASMVGNGWKYTFPNCIKVLVQ